MKRSLEAQVRRDLGRKMVFVGGPRGEASESMTRKLEYSDEPLGKLKVIPEFLPPPAHLVFGDEGGKATTSLSRRGVEILERKARRYKTQ